MDGAKKLAHLLEGYGAKYARTDATGGTLFTVSTGDGQYFVLVRDDGAGIEMWSRYFTPEQAVTATVGERNPDGLPIGLTISDDGNLLNWVGENYVRQDAATVGRGNLTAEQVREAIMSADRWRKPMGDTGMTNTHLIIRDDGWQAIADELNAAVGVGTCHFKVVIDQDPSPRHRGNICECDKCGYRCARGFIEDERFKYCPNCGARVVSE